MVDIGCQAGQDYRTVTGISASVFVCAASLPGLSDEGEMKPGQALPGRRDRLARGPPPVADSSRMVDAREGAGRDLFAATWRKVKRASCSADARPSEPTPDM